MKTVKEIIKSLSKLPQDMEVYSDSIYTNLKGQLVFKHENTKEEKEHLEKLNREYQERMDRRGEITSFANRW